jgi:holo-[acyl-carrier protein] synthase
MGITLIRHGIDLVEIAELQRWVDDPRDPFVPRCFTPEEVQEIGTGPDRMERIAGRFAAKEAVLKALGTGFGAGIAYTDVIVRRATGEPPRVHLRGGALNLAVALGISEWQLSISHTPTTAAASAIALAH